MGEIDIVWVKWMRIGSDYKMVGGVDFIVVNLDMICVNEVSVFLN